MIFVVGILTFLLVLNCMFLILLVLVQLPKKDAGAGMAFGAGTADALFGAGSGNILTKTTAFAAGILLALALVLGWLQSHIRSENSAADFTKMVEKQQQAPVTAPTQQPKSPTPASSQNNLLSTMVPTVATNTATTNTAVKAPANPAK